ncbi:hypothetical protein BX600DRAFT_473270 [Xylariales sp. PMI_506]|nr:hypothetical protein BX600DRAFT_473270 [Xylariales sp. PMI_506]
MPRGRPRAVPEPCQFCGKCFRRVEHRSRHERTHTKEKPFTCDCGQSFARKDLLNRHAKLSHKAQTHTSPSIIDTAPTSQTVPTPTAFGSESHVFDPLWDLDFMTQDILPSTIWDTDFTDLSSSTVLRLQSAPKECNISHFSSRLPALDEDPIATPPISTSDGPNSIIATSGSPPWTITQSCYDRLCFDVQIVSSDIPGCSIPSRNSLTQNLEKYFRCIQEYLPFIHGATFSPDDKTTELLLAIAALGALYRYEHAKAYGLYFMAKAILTNKERQHDSQIISDVLSKQDYSSLNPEQDLEKVQTIILLTYFASWTANKLLPDAISWSGQLAMLARRHGISDADQISRDTTNWLRWVALEEKSRTLLSAYIALNLHSIAFGIPPALVNQEIGVCLPGCSQAWKATNETQWSQCIQQAHIPFEAGLQGICEGTGMPGGARISSFSNYVLIHGILQYMYMDKSSKKSLDAERLKFFEGALRAWQRSWENTDESSLDPSYDKGVFGLTATALLRLAYIRLTSDLLPFQSLLLGDLRYPDHQKAQLMRLPHVYRAALHATHALCIPVRHGIESIVHQKTSIWSVEHSISGLECMVLLRSWLLMMSDVAASFGAGTLGPEEARLIDMVAEIIRETKFADSLSIVEDDGARLTRMAGTVVKIWAQIFDGVNILEIENVIGAGLRKQAENI